MIEKPLRTRGHSIWVLAVAASSLTGYSTLCAAQSIDTGAISISIVDEVLTESSRIVARFDVIGCTGVFPLAVRLDSESSTVDLGYGLSSLDSLEGFDCPFARTRDIPFGPVYQSGDYTLNLYERSPLFGSQLFDEENRVGTIEFSVGETRRTANPETPLDGSVQSGIGVIRGWACDARTVEVSFNDLPPLSLAYGTSREDTRSVCGDANNGYGAVFAFGSLGNGTHTMTTWIDGVDRGTVIFEVNGLPNPFVEGLSAEYELPHFPVLGQEVLIRWSQADQNFIIVDHSR